LNKQKRRATKPHTAQKISLKHNQIILDYSSQIVYNINCGYGEFPMFERCGFRTLRQTVRWWWHFTVARVFIYF